MAQLHPQAAEIFAEHYDFVWRSARRLGVAAADLDDVVQDTFVIVIHKLEAAAAQSVRSWIYVVLRNVAANYRRQTSRLQKQSDGVMPDETKTQDPSPEKVYATSETVSRLDELMSELSEPDREAFVLLHLEDFTAQEAAAILGVPANTLYSRARTARTYLQRRFEQSPEIELRP